MDIPPNFDKPWDLSDVVLLTEDSDGKQLYAFKAVLAMYSPYFKAMFYSSFKEAEASEVEIPVDYDAMLCILRYIHHIESKIEFDPRESDTKELETFKLEKFARLYRAADMLDFPIVRAKCVSLLKNGKPQRMVKAVFELDLHDVMMDILLSGKNKCSITVLSTLSDQPKPFFSIDDIHLLYLKITGHLPQKEPRSSTVINLEYTVIENPRIDLTQKWEMSDVAIKTIGSEGGLLYSNKQTIPTHNAFYITEDESKDNVLKNAVGGEFVTVTDRAANALQLLPNVLTKTGKRFLHVTQILSLSSTVTVNDLLHKDWEQLKKI